MIACRSHGPFQIGEARGEIRDVSVRGHGLINTVTHVVRRLSRANEAPELLPQDCLPVNETKESEYNTN